MPDRVKGACLTMGGAACWGISGCMGQYLFTREQMDSAWLVPIRLLLAGLLGIALLRCAMIAFVEVSSFGIGTSTMYLSTVHPLFLLYAFLSLAAYGRPIRRKERAL